MHMVMILVGFLVKHCFQITLINLVVLKVEEWLIYNISTITSSILILNLTTCVPKNICCFFLISRFEVSNSFFLSCHLLQSMPNKDFFSLYCLALTIIIVLMGYRLEFFH
jgi:hypothetical protein